MSSQVDVFYEEHKYGLKVCTAYFAINPTSTNFKFYAHWFSYFSEEDGR